VAPTTANPIKQIVRMIAPPERLTDIVTRSLEQSGAINRDIGVTVEATRTGLSPRNESGIGTAPLLLHSASMTSSSKTIGLLGSLLFLQMNCGSDSLGRTGTGGISGSGGINGTGGINGSGGGAAGARGGSDAGGQAGHTQGADGGMTCTSACASDSICVARGSEGGAVILPNDAGVCPSGMHLAGELLDFCTPDLSYSCVTIPAECGGTVTCACAGWLCGG